MHVSVYWFCFSLSKRKLAYKTRSYTSKWRWDDASQAIFLLEICLILLILFNSTQLSCFWAQTKKIDIMNHSILDLRWPDVHVTSLQKQGTFFSNGVTKPRKSWGSHLIGSRGLWNTLPTNGPSLVLLHCFFRQISSLSYWTAVHEVTRELTSGSQTTQGSFNQWMDYTTQNHMHWKTVNAIKVMIKQCRALFIHNRGAWI